MCVLMSSLILAGCSTKPIIEYRTVEVPVERIVPVPAELTKPLEPPEPLTNPTWLEIAVRGRLYQSLWQRCEIDRKAIRGLGSE